MLYKTFGGRLKFFGIGGSKLDPVVEDFLKKAHFPYAIGYGLTETAPLICNACVGKTAVGSIGVPAWKDAVTGTVKYRHERARLWPRETM